MSVNPYAFMSCMSVLLVVPECFKIPFFKIPKLIMRCNNTNHYITIKNTAICVIENMSWVITIFKAIFNQILIYDLALTSAVVSTNS